MNGLLFLKDEELKKNNLLTDLIKQERHQKLFGSRNFIQQNADSIIPINKLRDSEKHKQRVFSVKIKSEAINHYEHRKKLFALQKQEIKREINAKIKEEGEQRILHLRLRTDWIKFGVAFTLLKRLFDNYMKRKIAAYNLNYKISIVMKVKKRFRLFIIRTYGQMVKLNKNRIRQCLNLTAQFTQKLTSEDTAC